MISSLGNRSVSERATVNPPTPLKPLVWPVVCPLLSMVNPPAANKYQHWENPKLPPTFEEWFEGAVEKPGSWWPHWAEWLHARSGGWVEARDPTKGKYPPLADAPGDYVKVRS